MQITPKSSRQASRGFSLVEILVVVGVLSLLAAGALLALRASQNAAFLEDGKSQVVRALESARSRAATGGGTANHGVYIEASSITAFEGATYTGSGETYLLPPGITTNQAGAAIIFTRLTGQANTNATVTLSNGSGMSSSVAVSQNGAITP